MSLSPDAHAGCFLCAPDPDLIYARSGSFFAMLGHGPLGPGYSLIATVEHDTSMLDLDATRAQELDDFTAVVRATLGEVWPGGTAVTEHGRVAVCMTQAAARHEPHCLHAHRLVFPGTPDVDLRAVREDVREYSAFLDAYTDARRSMTGPYLYAERDDGTCQLAAADRDVPRQALRRLVAVMRGQTDLADWHRHPQLEVVAAAQRALGLPATANRT